MCRMSWHVHNKQVEHLTGYYEDEEEDEAQVEAEDEARAEDGEKVKENEANRKWISGRGAREDTFLNSLNRGWRMGGVVQVPMSSEDIFVYAAEIHNKSSPKKKKKLTVDSIYTH